MAEKEQGTVRWFNNKKGYGFLQKKSDGKDIFVHFSAIEVEGYKTLKAGDNVEFDITDGDKGPQASKVSVIGGIATTPGKAEEKPAVTPETTEDQ